ncbi:hypothetical protein T439DRAFT_348551 [Meredithblackwellia eburnea MCA 4105]
MPKKETPTSTFTKPTPPPPSLFGAYSPFTLGFIVLLPIILLLLYGAWSQPNTLELPRNPFQAPPATLHSQPPIPKPHSTPSNYKMSSPAPIVIGPVGEHTASIIFAHGLGDSANGWTSFARSMSAKFPGVKFILPTAPTRLVTVAGRKMTAWFDVRQFGNNDPKMEDQEGIMESVEKLNELVQAEVDSGIPEGRIVVGGFSQGCVLALLTGVSSTKPLAGILGLSGFLGLYERIPSVQTELSKSIPFFWGHGTDDQMIRLAKAETGVKILQDAGINLDFKTYEGMQHQTCPEEMVDIQAFLQKVLP